MRLGELLFVVLLASAAALLGSDATDAQQDKEGLLAFHESSAIARPGGYVSSVGENSISPAGLFQECEVLVFDDLSNVRLRAGTQPLDISELVPLKKSPLNQDGSLFLYLAPGTYAVMERNCIPVNGGLIPDYRYPIDCCPRVESKPSRRELKNEDGDWVAYYIPVQIRADETTRVTVMGLPEKELLRTLIFATLGVVVAMIIGGAVLASWLFRARYDPKSDPIATKSLPAPDPEYRPADFDKVFGDFLKKKQP